MENTNNLPAAQNNLENLNPISVLKTLSNLTKIKEFDKIGHLVIPICNKHAVLTGINKEIDTFSKEEIAKYTLVHLKNLTLEEIEIAFQNERFGLYQTKSNHYNFFSIDYYIEITTKYKEWKKEQMTIHNIPIEQILLPETSKSTKEEEAIKTIRREFINMIFNELESTKKEYIYDSFTLYETFVEFGLIDVTDERKKSLYSIMLKETAHEIEVKIESTSNKPLKKELKLALKNIEQKKNNNAINRSKAYLVCESIKSFIKPEDILTKINL